MHVRCNYDWALIYSEQKKGFFVDPDSSSQGSFKIAHALGEGTCRTANCSAPKISATTKSQKIYIAWGQEQRTHKQFQMFQNKH